MDDRPARSRGDSFKKEQPTYYASAVIHHKNDSQLIQLYHATLDSPATSTFVEASERGYLLDCLSQLIVQKICRNKPHNIIATSFGHLDQTRRNYKSTKTAVITLPVTIALSPAPSSPKDSDNFPPVEPAPTHNIYG